MSKSDYEEAVIKQDELKYGYVLAPVMTDFEKIYLKRKFKRDSLRYIGAKTSSKVNFLYNPRTSDGTREWYEGLEFTVKSLEGKAKLRVLFSHLAGKNPMEGIDVYSDKLVAFEDVEGVLKGLFDSAAGFCREEDEKINFA